MQMLKKYGWWIILGLIGLGLGIWWLLKPRKVKPTPGTKLLFIGSSSTADVNSYADIIGTRYPDLVISKIAQVGATTQWMKDAALAEINTGQYAGIYFFGGLNDIYAGIGAQAAENNLQSMFSVARATGAMVAAVTLQPTHYYDPFTDEKGQQTIDLNNWLESNKSLDHVIDLYSMTVGADGLQDISHFATDHLHLTYTTQSELATQTIIQTFS